MPADPDEITRREAIARDAIKSALATPGEESSVTLFVSHHLEELSPDYWREHLGTATPEPPKVLDLLVLQSHWGGEAEIDTFDFTLPEEVTNYLISVRFGEDGEVSEIDMES